MAGRRFDPPDLRARAVLRHGGRNHARVLLGAAPAVDRLLTPTLDVGATLPGAAVVPVLILLLGTGRLTSVALVALTVVWPILHSTTAAVRAIPPTRIDAAATLGLRAYRRWTQVLLPSVVPQLFVALRVASALTLIITLLTDILGTGTGVGRLIVVLAAALRRRGVLGAAAGGRDDGLRGQRSPGPNRRPPGSCSSVGRQTLRLMLRSPPVDWALAFGRCSSRAMAGLNGRGRHEREVTEKYGVTVMHLAARLAARGVVGVAVTAVLTGLTPSAAAVTSSEAVTPTSGVSVLPYGPDTCAPGFVWREASPSDHVCVTSDTREITRKENELAASHREPNGGAYGPNTCKPGFVWREAFDGDVVCVLPDRRAQVQVDTAQGPTHRAVDEALRPRAPTPSC